MARPLLRRRGSQAILARELGVHRARIGEFLRNGSAMPDAERALRLLVLLARTARTPDTGASPDNVRNTNIGPEAD
jgi:transcriptional regulator with XRE-family HTH domain